MSDPNPDVSEAVLSIPLPDMAEVGMAELLDRCRTAGLRDFSELVCSDGGCVMHVVTAEPLPGEEMGRLEYVEWWETIRVGPDGAAAIGKVMPPDDIEALGPAAEQGVAATDHGVEGDALTVSIVGDRGDIADRVRSYEDAGASPTIERLAGYDGERAPLDAITERQREVLEEAHRRGYFEVPRQTSTAEIAEALDLDDSTVAEHLQRAQRSLLDELLEY